MSAELHEPDLIDGMPKDIEPGFTLHRVEIDIEFLAFAMPDTFEAEIDLLIWRAKHRRTRQ